MRLTSAAPAMRTAATLVAALSLVLLPTAAQAATSAYRVSITKVADRSVPQNWDLVVSAKVLPVRQARKTAVSVQASIDGLAWKTIKTTKLSATASLSKLKVPTGKLSVGSWRIKVCKGAGKGLQAGCSAPLPVTIQPKPKFGVSLSIADRTLVRGQQLVVSGKVSPASQAKNATVAVQASSAGATWRTLQTVKLNSKATFSAVKITTGLADGEWQIRACKSGNSRYQTGCTASQRVTIGTVPSGPAPQPTPSGGAFDREGAAEFVRLLNQVRVVGYTCTGTGRVMAPTTQLPTDTYATQAAEGHAKDMVDRNYFNHTTLGTTIGPYDRLAALIPPGRLLNSVLESNAGNGVNTASPALTLADLLASRAGHCEQLMDPRVNAVGVAWYRDPSKQSSAVGSAWVIEQPQYVN